MGGMMDHASWAFICDMRDREKNFRKQLEAEREKVNLLKEEIKAMNHPEYDPYLFDKISRELTIEREKVSELKKLIEDQEQLHHKEIIDLLEKVRKLVEALKFECGNRCSDINPCNAKEVLKEIEEL